MNKKRSVKSEPIILDEQLLPKLGEIVEKTRWPYKLNKEQLQLRDQALVSFFILTGIRNREHQQIRKKQTRIYDTHILVVNVQPSKRGILRDEIILPKRGGLAPFTINVEKWLQNIPDDDCVLFPSANPSGQLMWQQPLSRQRVHWIIKSTSGMFPHWFRGVCETIYGKQVFHNDAWALQNFMGLADLNSTSPYVSGHWKSHEKNVYEVS